jgi:Flp pilus assembly protein TadD
MINGFTRTKMTVVVRACSVVMLGFLWSSASLGQEEIDPRYKTADTNNAEIHGRVILPSGFLLDSYAKITLRNAQSVIQTLHTSKSGEFQIANLSEGVYYVQAESLDGVFEPVSRKIELGRGLRVNLNLELRERKAVHISGLASRVVSAAELSQKIPTDAKKAYEQGLKAVRKGKFLEAATLFEQALQVFPEYLAARNDLGAQYLKLERVEEAEKQFKLVLAIDPKNFNAKFNMGLVEIEQTNYMGALAHLNQAVSLNSTRAVPHLWIGIAKLELGYLREAEQSLERALLMGGEECIAAHYQLARIYVSRGQLEDASRSLQVYLKQSPQGEYSKKARELSRQIGSLPK